MIVLGFDLETTSLDPANAEIIEVGAVLWDTYIGTPLILTNVLVTPTQPLSAEITQVTGITQKMLDSFGGDAETALRLVATMTKKAQALVAHNGIVFDFPILDRYAEKLHIPLLDIPRLDTLTDVPYPASTTSRKLRHLAADLGIIMPFAHRAVFDVLGMLQILNQYRVEEVIQIAQSPMVTVQALVGYETRELAKSEGFHFENDHGQKQWLRNMRQVVWEAERGKWRFQSIAMK